MKTLSTAHDYNTCNIDQLIKFVNWFCWVWIVFQREMKKTLLFLKIINCVITKQEKLGRWFHVLLAQMLKFFKT